MRIIADDLEYSSKVFPNIDSWNSSDLQTISKSGIPFIIDFFPKDILYTSDLSNETNGLGNLLLITKFSEQSQFDLLYKLSRNSEILPDGVICLADSGAKFHGYRNRSWQAKPGNLHLSFFKRPNVIVDKFNAGFTILAAVSVIQTLDLIPEIKNKTMIKWVNDVYIEDAKLCGVMTQTHTTGELVSGVCVGIGLNIETAPPVESSDFVKNTICLNQIDKIENKYGIDFILKHLLNYLAQNYKKLIYGEFQFLMDIYRSRSMIIGREVVVCSDPVKGMPEILWKGRVANVGENLELIFENKMDPITTGRIVLL